MSKVWFVTGASSGIGTGVVKAALQAGHRVVATARNLEKLRTALGEGDGERLALMKLDVAQEAQAAPVVAAAVARFGRVDALVGRLPSPAAGRPREARDSRASAESSNPERRRRASPAPACGSVAISSTLAAASAMRAALLSAARAGLARPAAILSKN